MPLPIVFILITVMIDAMGIGLIMPVMPDLIKEVTGEGLGQAALWGGVMVTSFAADAIPVRPGSGQHFRPVWPASGVAAVHVHRIYRQPDHGCRRGALGVVHWSDYWRHRLGHAIHGFCGAGRHVQTRRKSRQFRPLSVPPLASVSFWGH